LFDGPALLKPAASGSQPVSSIDFYSTFLDITGLAGEPKHNDDMDGLSLVPRLKRNPDANLKWDVLYWHYPHYYAATSLAQQRWVLNKTRRWRGT